jgi:SAM-dependent methyltransferase
MSIENSGIPSWQDNYELGRPGWPSQVATVAGLAPTAAIADLGAGTGKLTQVLVAEYDQVVAIEPDLQMQPYLRARCPGVRILTGSSDEIPLAPGSVDAVFIAEAFHLFATQDTVSEISRVLRPGGALVLLWNLPAGATEPSIDRALELLTARGPDRAQAGYEPTDLNPARYASGEWRRAFSESDFGEFNEARLDHVQVLDRDGLIAFFGSMGWIFDLPVPERQELVSELRALLPAEQYRRPWRAHVHWARLG